MSQGLEAGQLPERRKPPARFRRPPKFFSDTEEGRRLATSASIVIGAIGAALAHVVAWPIRLLIGAALAVGLRSVLWLVVRRLGEGDTATAVNRALSASVATCVSGLMVYAFISAVTDHDPDALMIAIVLVLFPIWWYFLRWWAATSPTAPPEEL